MGTRERIFELADQKFNEQKDFASALDVPVSIVSNWRTGRSTSFMKYLPQIAEVLETTAEYLLTGEAQTQPAPGSQNPQLDKLRRALKANGVDLNKLTEEELNRLAKIAAAALSK